MTSRTCPNCSTPTSELTDGLCPKCLLRADLASNSNHEDATLDSSPSSMAVAETVVGQQFGGYELIEEIARGGMGVVYRARDLKLNREVALKMILAGQLAGQQDIERFRREAEAAANLEHSGIVPICEIGDVDGQHFFSMKLVEGGSLADHMTELRKDTREIVALLVKVARGVHFAHQRGILHRDIKPANILIDETGAPVITDLGLAKQMDSDSGLTHTGAVVGTPSYMPPEQAAAKKQITTAADIYSLGAILYEALTSEPPHRAGSPIETLMHVLDSAVVPPSEKQRKVDRNLELICMKCLSRDPNDRYSSAAALADDLENWLQGKPVSVKPRSALSLMSEIVLTNVRGAIGAALVGMIAGLAVAFLLSRARGDGDVQEHPPTEVYQLLPGEISIGRNLVFVPEYQLGSEALVFGPLGALFVLGITGWLVAAVTRARYGAESFAIGVIASILMSVMMVIFCFGGPNLDPLRDMMCLLAQGTLGTEATRSEVRTKLFELFPTLDKIPAEEQAVTLAYRVFYDSYFHHPIHMLLGVVGAVVLCVATCVPLTSFAAKLRHGHHSRIRSVLAYSECAFLLVILVFTFWLQTLLPATGSDGVPPIIVGRWGYQLFLYSFLVAMSVAIYRGSLNWKWRLVIYCSFVLTSGYWLRP